nr:hypothetical protein CFP56_71606 [Quercus suber]
MSETCQVQSTTRFQGQLLNDSYNIWLLAIFVAAMFSSDSVKVPRLDLTLTPIAPQGMISAPRQPVSRYKWMASETLYSVSSNKPNSRQKWLLEAFHMDKSNPRCIRILSDHLYHLARPEDQKWPSAGIASQLHEPHNAGRGRDDRREATAPQEEVRWFPDTPTNNALDFPPNPPRIPPLEPPPPRSAVARDWRTPSRKRYSTQPCVSAREQPSAGIASQLHEPHNAGRGRDDRREATAPQEEVRWFPDTPTNNALDFPPNPPRIPPLEPPPPRSAVARDWFVADVAFWGDPRKECGWKRDDVKFVGKGALARPSRQRLPRTSLCSGFAIVVHGLITW